MDRVKFVRDCITDYMFLEDKTRNDPDLPTDDRYKVREYLQTEHKLRFHQREVFYNHVVIQGGIENNIFIKMVEEFAKSVAREMTWIKGYDNAEI